MITADQFSTAALAWIGAITTVAIAAGAAWVKILPMANQIKTLFRLHETNAANIQSNQKQIVDVALSVPPQPTQQTPNDQHN